MALAGLSAPPLRPVPLSWPAPPSNILPPTTTITRTASAARPPLTISTSMRRGVDLRHRAGRERDIKPLLQQRRWHAHVDRGQHLYRRHGHLSRRHTRHFWPREFGICRHRTKQICGRHPKRRSAQFRNCQQQLVDDLNHWGRLPGPKRHGSLDLVRHKHLRRRHFRQRRDSGHHQHRLYCRKCHHHWRHAGAGQRLSAGFECLPHSAGFNLHPRG